MSAEQPHEPAVSPETLHAAASMRAGYEATIYRLASNNPASKIPLIMDRALAAAHSGDAEAFEEHYLGLLEVGDEMADPALPFTVYGDVFANGELLTLDLAGVTVGNERSFNNLGNITINERERIREELKYKPQEFDARPYGAYTPGENVNALLANCIKIDTPPNAWLDMASLDPMHKWTLYMEYYKRLAADGKPEQQINALSIGDSLAAELLHTNSFSPGFIQAAVKEMLEVTSDPERQLALLARGHESIKDNPRKDPTVDTHWAADITLAYISSKQGHYEDYDPGVRYVHEHLETAITKFHKAGITHIRQKTIDSFVNLAAAMLHMGRRGAASLVDGVNAIMQFIGPTAGSESEGGEGMLFMARDRALQRFAVLAAEADNFSDAHTLLAEIFNDDSRNQALSSCYRSVKEPADLEALDDANLFVNPTLAPRHDRLVVEAKLGNDPEKIAEAILTITREASRDMKYRNQLEELYEQLAELDPALAERTGEQALATFRELYDGRGYTFIGWLAEAIIRTGNIEEMVRAYAQIIQSPIDDAAKLVYLRRITQAIDGAYPDLPKGRDAVAETAQSGEGKDPITDAIVQILRTME